MRSFQLHSKNWEYGNDTLLIFQCLTKFGNFLDNIQICKERTDPKYYFCQTYFREKVSVNYWQAVMKQSLGKDNLRSCSCVPYQFIKWWMYYTLFSNNCFIVLRDVFWGFVLNITDGNFKYLCLSLPVATSILDQWQKGQMYVFYYFFFFCWA